MKLFSYPEDLFTLALLTLTLIALITVAVNKQSTKRQKYGALSVTFCIAALVGLIALYSIPLAVTIYFAIGALCSVRYYVVGREERRIRAVSPSRSNLEFSASLETILLPDSDPRPFPGTRLIK